MTRKLKAKELLERLTRGPSLSCDVFGIDGIEDLTKEQKIAAKQYFESSYRNWADAWIISQVCELVPELKEHKS